MRYFYLLGLLLIGFQTTAQQFEITGQLVDKEDGSPLESATIFVESLKDSTLISYTISNREGKFMIEGKAAAARLRLAGSYAGYVPLNRLITLDKPRVDLGTIEMELADNMLAEVLVTASRSPVTVKSDTLEFNAESFTTRPDANLEDVMKKLPGVEVDAQGSITVNGKPVSRILVNGKEFFGNDPKIATKNLPKEIIDKIQVVDTRTRAEEFTGKAGDPDDKTINITIKKDKSRGYFARATAGGGTDERYELSGIGNYFQDDLRVSVLASSNNINSSGFSFDEVYDMMGRNARSIAFRGNGGFSINGSSFGGSGGITKSETAGFNFTNDWNKKYELNADYFFGRNDTETREVVERENFLPQGTYYQNSVSSGNLLNDSHRANLAFEVQIDTLTKLSFRPSVSVNDGFSHRSRATETLDEDRQLTNRSATLDREEIRGSSLNNRIDLIRKFGSRGAYLQLDFRNQNDSRENQNNFYSERLRYTADGNEELVETRDQLIDQENSANRYQAEVTQRSVLAEKLFLDLSYQFSTEQTENTRDVFDYNQNTGGYNDFNELLSNAFEVKSVKHIPNAGINLEGQKWRTGLSAGLLHTSLENENFRNGSLFNRSYNDLYVNANVRYEIKRGASVYAYYRSDTDIPSIRELQPVADVTDPLNIFIGNPGLDPAYSHRINIGYRNFDFATRSGFNLFASATITENQVVPYSVTDDNFVRTTTYRNVDGGYNAFAGSFYSKRMKYDNSEFNYRLGANTSYSKQVGFINTVRFNARRLSATPGLRLGFNWKELVEVNPRYELTYVYSDYDINNNRTEEYINHAVGLEGTTFWPAGIVFGNDISYNYFGNVAPGFDATSLLWNMSLGYKFLKDAATLKVKVYDLLNENVSTSRTTGQDFVQDRQELILEQYFMLSFTYKLSKFGGKDPNQRRSGGMRRF